MSKEQLSKSINLLNPLFEPEDSWTSMYEWVLKIGKYIIVIVTVVVLSVFFARFYFDTINNNLSKEINVKIDTVLGTPQKESEVQVFTNYLSLLNDVDTLSLYQKINSENLSNVLDTIPKELSLKSISFRDTLVEMTFEASNFEDVGKYSTKLTNDTDFSDVKVSVSKQMGSLVEFNVSFNISDK